MNNTTTDLIQNAIAGRHPNSEGFIRVNCPFCDLRTVGEDRSVSFAVNARSGWCACFRCGFRGRYRGELDFDLPALEEQAAPPEKVEPPEGYYPLWEGDGLEAMVFAPARRYLRKRGVSLEQIEEMKIGACLEGDFAGRIIVPVLAPNGDWQWYVGRAWDKSVIRRYHYPKGRRESVLFNSAALELETDEPVFVVEGVFDAIPHWPDAVACLGKPNDAQRDRIATTKRPVVVALDGDAWEEAWADALRITLRGHERCVSIRLPPKTDPGDTSRERLRALALEALSTQGGRAA